MLKMLGFQPKAGLPPRKITVGNLSGLLHLRRIGHPSAKVRSVAVIEVTNS